ncbi:hypothetical protein CVT24_008712 [Panaeolus cyanescens]|uniref:C3H1-type domain-containing protein n=1 Tax=Panaeolus cyanescens TaxID=181874 RepID=A0A409VKH0_9AGAR|nr:hypothetical protein CVT24_008712 [Panaeolus cyanescens]
MNPTTNGELLPQISAPKGIVHHFEQLREEILNLMQSDVANKDLVQRLNDDLSVYKQAFFDLKSKHDLLQQDMDRQREYIASQLKGHRVIVLVDGDGAIFTTQLISQGQAGGHQAAEKLADSIAQYLGTTNGLHQYQLWVYVFLNKRGLIDVLGRMGYPVARARLEEFMVGFNQAADHFILVDVGSAKEAADAKIKALLEDEIKLPQTEKIIFGGCHDNGYVTTLRTQLTAGFKHKLILLRSYTEMAAGINELELPSFTIPDLFLPQKLGTGNPSSPKMAAALTASNPTSGISNSSVNDGGPFTPKQIAVPVEEEFEALPFANADSEVVTKERRSPISYSSALQKSIKRLSTPELDSGSSSDDVESVPSRRSSVASSTGRRINPNISLSKHKPPPCTLYYLSTCKHGNECKYAHDYDLRPEHYAEIRVNAKKSPCPAKNKAISSATLRRNTDLENRVAELEVELLVWKRAHSVVIEASERQVKAHNVQIATLNRQIASLDYFKNNQSALILCIINGDELIFNREYFSQGYLGGRAAAQRLTQAIAEQLSNEEFHVYGHLSFWTTIFFNKAEIAEDLASNNFCTHDQYQAFLAGLSQASPRFSLVDVAHTKETTEAKIKEYLQTYIYFPQTLRIYFGGYDPSPYLSLLNSLEKEQLLGKISVISHSQDQDMNGERQSLLVLPRLVIDGLFHVEKLVRLPKKLAPLSTGSYSSVTSNGLISPESPGSSLGRPIDPSLPLHKRMGHPMTLYNNLDAPSFIENPPPCNEHYLMSCSKGAGTCKYSHDYVLTPEQLVSLANNAKKAPCNWLKNGEREFNVPTVTNVVGGMFAQMDRSVST